MEEVPSQPPAPEKRDPLVRAVRSLTIAVRCMAGALFLMFGLFVYAVLWPMMRYTRTTSTSAPSSHASASTAYQPDFFEGKQFHELTTEKKIKYASVILLTKHLKAADGRTTSVISEIVKQKPGTELHYKVGEEFYPFGRTPLNDESAADGEVVMMIGSPADMRESSSYTGDRLDSMGGMTLAELRELAKQEGK